MRDCVRRELDINGVSVTAEYASEDVERVFVPLLAELTRRRRGMSRRLIAFLAAPPGAGKSTLAAFLEQLSRERPGLTRVQALGMDGFHHHADYIASHTVLRGGVRIPMARVKGAPESFDVDKLRQALTALRIADGRFPVYDRRLHDVVEDAVAVDAPVVLLEGNWLLLDEPAWRELPRDYAIYLDAPEDVLRGRVIGRRLATGRTAEEAERLWTECDGPNAALCARCHTHPDALLRLNGGRIAQLY